MCGNVPERVEYVIVYIFFRNALRCNFPFLDISALHGFIHHGSSPWALRSTVLYVAAIGAQFFERAICFKKLSSNGSYIENCGTQCPGGRTVVNKPMHG
jgi:hypothetical protein